MVVEIFTWFSFKSGKYRFLKIKGGVRGDLFIRIELSVRLWFYVLGCTLVVLFLRSFFGV